MALANAAYLGDGSNRVFSVTFPYLSKSNVKLYLDNVSSIGFTWLTDVTIQTTTAPASGVVVLIKRETPTVPLVDFVDGSTLTEDLLDTSALQGLYVVEESKDSLTSVLQLDTTDDKMDGLNKVIKNVGNPTEDQEVATKYYVDVGVASQVTIATESNAEAVALLNQTQALLGSFTISTSNPSGGEENDVWFKVSL